MAPSLRPEDIEHKTFTVVRVEAGYRQQEVDDFLDEVHTAYAAMWADNANLEQRNSVAAAAPLATVNPATVQLPVLPPVAPAPVQVEPTGPSLATISLLLEQAEATAAKLVADAKIEAEHVKGSGYADAAQLKTDALAAAGQLKADAHAGIEKLKADVTADIAQAKTEAESFVAKIKADAGTEASALLTSARAERDALVAHVDALKVSKSSILSVLKEVVAKVEGK